MRFWGEKLRTFRARAENLREELKCLDRVRGAGDELSSEFWVSCGSIKCEELWYLEGGDEGLAGRNFHFPARGVVPKGSLISAFPPPSPGQLSLPLHPSTTPLKTALLEDRGYLIFSCTLNTKHKTWHILGAQ